MAQFICPYCFDRINSSEPGWIGKLFGMRPTAKDVCPTCSRRFPNGITSLSNVMIAIVGDRDTGKSNYIAVLIHRIKELFLQFGWCLLAIDDDTDKLYNRVFYAPLYGQEGIAYTVRKTAAASGGNEDVKRPLLYTLGMSSGNKYKVITLAFFDTAGEDLRTKPDIDTDETMKVFNRYIYNASGIIMLVDPTGIDSLRTRVGLAKTTAANAREMETIFTRIARVIQSEKYRSFAKKIDIPFAVSLSKIDLFRSVFQQDTSIFKRPKHNGYVNLSEIENNSQAIEGCITDNDSIMLQAAQSFKNVRFFGVSALGEDPEEVPHSDVKKLVKSPHPVPVRVEDPFLWILCKNNFLKGK